MAPKQEPKHRTRTPVGDRAREATARPWIGKHRKPEVKKQDGKGKRKLGPVAAG